MRHCSVHSTGPGQGVPSYHIAAWLGGSNVTSINAFQGLWLPQDVYIKNSPDTVHCYCF